MRLTITIDTDNTAFEPSVEFEIARILAEYAADVESGKRDVERPLYDYNGNTVGQAKVTKGRR